MQPIQSHQQFMTSQLLRHVQIISSASPNSERSTLEQPINLNANRRSIIPSN
jgi:hypothetical protein